VGGRAEGALAGGCLCLLAHACGSNFAPDFRGRIVLIEDVGEAVYRADRYLIQLRNAGLLQQAAGFVVGALTGWQKQEADPPRSTPDALWRDLLAPLGKPTITGFPFGHEANPLTLPLGVRVRLDADAKTLTLLESATIPS
jgi:muramoyltetrapeptide carboxypeptidase